jgi:hypothetical protein
LKTIRVTDDIHQQLTRLLGERVAKTDQPQTFNEVIADLLSEHCAKDVSEKKEKAQEKQK